MLVPSSEATDKRVSLMDRLRSETLGQHKEAESRPLERALAAGEVSRALYADYLVQRLFIHQKLEALMRLLLHGDGRLRRCVTDDLFQEANLRCDLQALGKPAAPDDLRAASSNLIKMFERAVAENPVGLLGVWYVFEGSKNGARFIARAVAATLHLQPGPGLTYLDPHGPAQRERWLSFRAAVDAEDWTSTEADAIVATAQLTFAGISAVDDGLWTTHAK